MGIYLNPGFDQFEISRKSPIFIDKTEMILFINRLVDTSQRYLAVSRPRRFGKSYAAGMLAAYYGKPESRHLFENSRAAKHEGWDKYLGCFDVIRLVMTDFMCDGSDVPSVLRKIRCRIMDELAEEYADVRFEEDDFYYGMLKFYKKTGRKFIIIIDEWDAVFRELKEDTDGQKLYLDFLRSWLKDKEYVALAYMTGILPIKKYGRHSALNMFDEYSMLAPRQLAPYTGFTEAEVRDLCTEYKMPYDEVSDWYDGYKLSRELPVELREAYHSQTVQDAPDPNGSSAEQADSDMRDIYSDYDYVQEVGAAYSRKISVYNPLSVVKAMINGQIENYWNKTETYEALAEYIRMNLEGLKDAVALMMAGGRVKIDVSGYQNDMTTFHGRDDVLTLLIHLGYLCYDAVTREVFIPNKEIMDEFKTSTRGEEWIDTFQAFRTSQELLTTIWSEDAERTAELMERAHDRASNKTYHDEAALSYGIRYALYAAQKYYTTIQELDSGKGYADIVYLPSPKYPDKPALLVELKYNKDVRTAMDQIRSRNYPQALEHYKGNILLVCVNYDKDVPAGEEGYKRHRCLIERV